MSNDDMFYNNEIKEKFINTFENESSRKIAMYPLRIAKKTEVMEDKDLHEMTIKEIEDILRSMKSSTLNAVYNNINQIEAYIDWTISHGYRKSNINPIHSLDKIEWAKPLVNRYRNYAFLREDIDELVLDLVNYVDRAILILLFEGAGGTGHSELLQLKKSDVSGEKGDYRLNLTDKDGTAREIKVTDELISVLMLADSQREYENKNGEALGEKYKYSPLEDSEYIFKKAIKGEQGKALTHTYVNRKFNIYKKVFGYEYLKASHIKNSGMMHMANQLQKDGKLDKDGLLAIGEQFNTTPTQVDGKSYRSLTIIRRVIESPDFEDLYGYALEIDVR